jgi:hypothetical protein
MPGGAFFHQVMAALNHGGALATLALLDSALHAAAAPAQAGQLPHNALHQDPRAGPCLLYPSKGVYWTLHPVPQLGNMGQLSIIGTRHAGAHYATIRIKVWCTAGHGTGFKWSTGVHQLVTWLRRGPQPEPAKVVAHHKCKVRGCCNWVHIVWQDMKQHAKTAGLQRVTNVPQLLLRYHGSGLFKPLNDANKVCVRPKHKNKLDLKRVLNVCDNDPQQVVEGRSLKRALFMATADA